MAFGQRPEARGKLSLDGADWDKTLRKADQQFAGFTSSVNRLAQRAALALGGMVVGSSLVGARFEDAMKAVEAVAGATSAELNRLEKSARAMGAATAFSATQAAQAQAELLKAGLSVNEALGALEGTMMFAGAAGAELAFSAELGAATMKAWSIEASEANRVFNALYASTAATRLSAESLNAAVASGGSVMALWGVSMEESLAVLGALTDQLGDGSTAGTYAKNIFADLNVAIAAQTGVLGKVLASWNPATHGIIGAVEMLEAAGVSADTVLRELGQRGGPGLAILLNRGSDALRDLEQKVTGTNAAFAAYEVRMDSTKGRWANLMSALEEGAIRTFNTLQPQIDRIIVLITTAVQNNFAAIDAAVAKLAEAMRATIGLFIDFHGWVERNSTVVGVLTSAFVGLTVAIYATRAAMVALTTIRAAVALGPVVVVIGAIAGALVYATEKLIGFKNILKQVKGETDSMQMSATSAAPPFWADAAGNAPGGAAGFDAMLAQAAEALNVRQEIAVAEVAITNDTAMQRIELLTGAADIERELKVRGHVETLALYENESIRFAELQQHKSHIFEEFSARTAHISAAIQEQTAKATSIQAVMQIKLGKILARVARDSAAAEIEAKGQVAAKHALFEAAMAIAALARFDFRGAALHGVAAAKFLALAGAAAIGAAALRHAPSSGSDEAGTSAEQTSGSDSPGRRTVDLTQRNVPETVNIHVTTNVAGNVIGEESARAFTDRYVAPRIRELMEGGAFA